jgi:hypothetical protein
MTAKGNVGAKRSLDSGEPAVENPTKSGEGSNDLSMSAVDAGLSEDAALALLRRPDVSPEVLERLAKNGNVLKYRKVKLALVAHPKTPRHVSLPLIRQLYTFDLMQVALTPAVPADVKLAADEALCNRIETVSSGEKLTLAHRASGRVAGELLLDSEPRVMQAALKNSRLTEALIVQALMRPEATAAFVEAVSHHVQWSLRREVRLALLRNEKTPMARAVEFARNVPVGQLREILQGSRLPKNVKSYLLMTNT